LAKKIDVIALPQPRSRIFISGSMGMIPVSDSSSQRAFGPIWLLVIQAGSYVLERG